ncbi:MAG: hypothetical protein Q8Q26_14025 [Pseudorhodobacter sp.]|nr:hypothetical protein [Pseudorhodobacter sp.]
MKIVADLSVTSAPMRERHGWHPGWLFRGGAQGAWFDPLDLSTMFQDAMGSVPVAADGDSVALMQDKSGKGNHAVQTIAARRPTWRTDGVLRWLEFDGVDDRMEVPEVAYSTSNFGPAIGLQYEPAGTKFGSWRSFLVDGPYIGLSNTSDSGPIQSTSGLHELNGAPAPTTRGTLRAALLSPGVGTVTGIHVAAFAGNPWQFCGYSSPGSPAAKVFGYVESEALTPSMVPRVRHWMAEQSGVVL